MRRILSIVFVVGCQASQPVAHRPMLDGDWWQITQPPDVAPYDNAGQQAVDFAIWQAADGTWQLQSCVRGTALPGHQRLFFRWQGQALSDTDWQPVGIAMLSDPSAGEPDNGLQAPYVFHQGKTWHLIFGDWDNIDHAISSDGKSFTRVLNAQGTDHLFSEGSGVNTRDPMVLVDGSLYRAYYTAYPNGMGQDYLRTSTDLMNWSDSKVVAYGGAAGTNGGSAECPFVVHLDGYYYLFRTQRYGGDAQTSIYRSPHPDDFGVNDDRYLIGTLPVAAPEIFEDRGQWYLAALRPGLDGMQLSKLAWK
jgi:hypothetical protein